MSGSGMDGDGADGGFFGYWTSDEKGLPAYEYTAMADLTSEKSQNMDHWHQLGNDRYTAEAHAGGWIVPYRWERGLVRLTERDGRGDWKKLAGVGVIDAAGAETPVLRHELPLDWKHNATWGVGYAKWNVESESFRIAKKVSSPFGDDPVLIIEVEIETLNEKTLYEERWPVIPYSLGAVLPMTEFSAAPRGIRGMDRVAWRAITGVSGALRRAGEIPRRLYARLIEWEIRSANDLIVGIPRYKNPFKTGSRTKRTWFDNHPAPVFLAVLESDVKLIGRKMPNGVLLSAQSELEPKKKNFIRLMFGWGPESDIEALVDKYRKKPADDWRPALPAFDISEENGIERETAWHGAYLRGMMVKDDYFENHIIPQGSAYSYLHGAHGAIRDYVFSTIPLIYMAPKRAKEFITAIARMTLPSGEMLYSHVGHGQSTGAGGIHSAPTDLPLFFIWAVLEYISATGDRSILDVDAPFYPKENGKSSTVRERISIAWKYMRDGVGTGPHDLLRAGTGDWNDPISYTVKKPGVFHRMGESCFNTAMALWVLPRAAKLVETWNAREAAHIESFASSLEKAMEHAWTGEWYLRGYDGENRPIGENRLFLDSSVWCLISGVGGTERMNKLAGHIYRLLDGPSPVGANILDKPVHMKYGILAPGWDCNGGVWAALNGLLCWGYSLYDPERAWRNLEKQSLANHARAYPHIWYGIWSGPDSYNAHWAEDPGHTFIHPLTPMREYPIMNSNQHAMPLLALLRMAGIEPSGTSLDVTPRMPERFDPWNLDFPLISVGMRDGNSNYKIKREPDVCKNDVRC